MNRPSLFIGSSSEGKEIAKHIRSQLKEETEATVWDEGLFGLGKGTLETLVEVAERFDFAVLALTPDDMIESRTQTAQSPRDNVLFECGLFMGHLGRRRTFLVYDQDRPIKIPSDLAGITLATYRGNRRDGDLKAAVGEACDPIRETIKKIGTRSSLSQIEVGSARLVYLLRYLSEERSFVRIRHVGQVLFSYKDPYAPIHSDYEEEGWKRAANYALYYLGLLGLVECTGTETKITEKGNEYLKLPKVRYNYSPAFAVDMRP